MPRIVREVRKTLLVVGEGDAEAFLLQKIRASLTANRVGPSVTVKNAKGKGALHVIGEVARHARHGSYDLKAAVVDTDTDWNQNVAARARRAGIVVIAHDPCLESMLLSAVGVSCANNSNACKRKFEQVYGGEAHEVLSGEFPLAPLFAAESRIDSLAQLLGLFR